MGPQELAAVAVEVGVGAHLPQAFHMIFDVVDVGFFTSLLSLTSHLLSLNSCLFYLVFP